MEFVLPLFSISVLVFILCCGGRQLFIDIGLILNLMLSPQQKEYYSIAEQLARDQTET